MKKYLLLFLMPALFASITVDSTEIDFVLSNQENYLLNTRVTDNTFQSVPSNPNVYSQIDTFLDRDLTEKASVIQENQKIKIVSVEVNAQNQQVFLLENGQYIAADPLLIYDDQIIETRTTEEIVWLKKGFTIYSSPIGNQQKILQTSLKAYQSVTISEIAATPVAVYVKIDGYGWLKTSDLSQEDNRMEAVQELLNTKYSSANIAVYVKQLSSQKTAGVNQDKLMYAASVTKLPVLYYVQEKIDQNEYSLTEGLQYIDKVTGFKGSYSAEGSGSLSKVADNRYYRIDELINKTAKESDNVASNILAYYMTNQFDASFNEEIKTVLGQDWDMSSRMASAQMAGLMMEAIYNQSGYVLDSLQSTQFDNQRIARDIPVPVAHKIGDAYDFRHDVAVVYADSPFILSIFTDQSDYETISKVANDVYGILK